MHYILDNITISVTAEQIAIKIDDGRGLPFSLDSLKQMLLDPEKVKHNISDISDENTLKLRRAILFYGLEKNIQEIQMV